MSRTGCIARGFTTAGLAALMLAAHGLGHTQPLQPLQPTPATASPAASPRTTPQEFSGNVTRVSDGDTLWVQPDPPADAAAGAPRRKPIKVRLVGLDAPERCQPHGEEATRALSRLVLNQRVTVRRRATDDYGRALGTLWLQGQDVAAQLVREGHAWSARYRRDLGPYAREEAAARAARRGLFAAPQPRPPRDFRREHGPCE